MPLKASLLKDIANNSCHKMPMRQGIYFGVIDGKQQLRLHMYFYLVGSFCSRENSFSKVNGMILWFSQEWPGGIPASPITSWPCIPTKDLTFVLPCQLSLLKLCYKAHLTTRQLYWKSGFFSRL